MSNSFSVRCIPPGIWVASALCLLVSLWGGSRLYHRPIKETPIVPVVAKPKIAVIFYVYDIRGNELSQARLEGPTSVVTPQVTGPKCVLSLEQDSSQTLEFSYQKHSYSIPVQWRSGDAYKTWLDNELPQRLSSLDSSYDKAKWQALVAHFKSVTTDTKYEYPVVITILP